MALLKYPAPEVGLAAISPRCAGFALFMVVACGFFAAHAQTANTPVPAAAQTTQTSPQATPPILQEPSKRLFSDEEINLLQQLDKRRVDLDRREQALRVREKLVDLAENRLNARIEAMQTLQTALDAELKSLSGKDENQLATLAKIYENMRPGNAATVLNRLDNAIIFDLFTRMKNKSTANIMNNMDPDKARDISRMLAEHSKLPNFN